MLCKLSDTKAEENAFGRYINNPKVTPSGIVSHYHTIERHDFTDKHVLIVQDTSTNSFGLHSERKGLGYVGEKTPKTGFAMHPAIYMDAVDGACYGLGGVSFWNTPLPQDEASEKEKLERRKVVSKLALEEKESYKWYSTVNQAIENNNSAAQYTIVGDREADIYELYSRYEQQGWGWLIRCSTNRKLLDE